LAPNRLEIPPLTTAAQGAAGRRRPDGAKIRKILATLTGNLYLVAGSLLMSLVAIAVGWLPPRGNWSLLVMRLWACSLLRASLVRVEARFAAELDPRASYVFLPNHQSMFDIPVLLATVPGQVRMMAKRSLFRIPFFGWALAAGAFISVDRKDRSGAREAFAAAGARLRQGTSILMFPEGTRSLTDTLLPFERGGFLLAIRSGLPIVPVGIRGTRAVQRKGSWSIRPGTVAVRYGAPLRVEDFGVRRKRELMEEVRARIAELAEISLPPGKSEPAAAGDDEG
jgi:1-acyl-sn-glycerol-3-phosphate acyltransferase